MKTNHHIGTVALIAAIVGIAAMLTACDDPPQTCDCTVKVHPYGEPCNCGLADCDCTEAEESKDRSDITEPNATITFGETEYDIIIKGGTGETFTDTEWTNATTKIKAALISAYNNNPDVEALPDVFYQAQFVTVINVGVTIVVEAFTGAEIDKNWKTSDDGITLYINRVVVDSLTSGLGNALIAMYSRTATTGKAMSANRVFMVTLSACHSSVWFRITTLYMVGA